MLCRLIDPFFFFFFLRAADSSSEALSRTLARPNGQISWGQTALATCAQQGIMFSIAFPFGWKMSKNSKPSAHDVLIIPAGRGFPWAEHFYSLRMQCDKRQLKGRKEKKTGKEPHYVAAF